MEIRWNPLHTDTNAAMNLLQQAAANRANAAMGLGATLNNIIGNAIETANTRDANQRAKNASVLQAELDYINRTAKTLEERDQMIADRFGVGGQSIAGMENWLSQNVQNNRDIYDFDAAKINPMLQYGEEAFKRNQAYNFAMEERQGKIDFVRTLYKNNPQLRAMHFGDPNYDMDSVPDAQLFAMWNSVPQSVKAMSEINAENAISSAKSTNEGVTAFEDALVKNINTGTKSLIELTKGDSLFHNDSQEKIFTEMGKTLQSKEFIHTFRNRVASGESQEAAFDALITDILVPHLNMKDDEQSRAALAGLQNKIREIYYPSILKAAQGINNIDATSNYNGYVGNPNGGSNGLPAGSFGAKIPQQNSQPNNQTQTAGGKELSERIQQIDQEAIEKERIGKIDSRTDYVRNRLTPEEWEAYQSLDKSANANSKQEKLKTQVDASGANQEALKKVSPEQQQMGQQEIPNHPTDIPEQRSIFSPLGDDSLVQVPSDKEKSKYYPVGSSGYIFKNKNTRNQYMKAVDDNFYKSMREGIGWNIEDFKAIGYANEDGQHLLVRMNQLPKLQVGYTAGKNFFGTMAAMAVDLKEWSKDEKDIDVFNQLSQVALGENVKTLNTIRTGVLESFSNQSNIEDWNDYIADKLGEDSNFAKNAKWNSFNGFSTSVDDFAGAVTNKSLGEQRLILGTALANMLPPKASKDQVKALKAHLNFIATCSDEDLKNFTSATAQKGLRIAGDTALSVAKGYSNSPELKQRIYQNNLRYARAGDTDAMYAVLDATGFGDAKNILGQLTNHKSGNILKRLGFSEDSFYNNATVLKADSYDKMPAGKAKETVAHLAPLMRIDDKSFQNTIRPYFVHNFQSKLGDDNTGLGDGGEQGYSSEILLGLERIKQHYNEVLPTLTKKYPNPEKRQIEATYLAMQRFEKEWRAKNVAHLENIAL